MDLGRWCLSGFHVFWPFPPSLCFISLSVGTSVMAAQRSACFDSYPQSCYATLWLRVIFVCRTIRATWRHGWIWLLVSKWRHVHSCVGCVAVCIYMWMCAGVCVCPTSAMTTKAGGCSLCVSQCRCE